MTGAAPTARDLLASAVLQGARLVGGAARLERRATGVRVLARLTAPPPEGAVVLLDAPARATSLEGDIALRHLAEGSGALLILPERLVGPTSARIADHLLTPTVAMADLDPWAVAHELDVMVRAPQLAQAEAALLAARAVAQAGAAPDAAVRRLGTVLRAPVAIVDAGGIAIAGRAPDGLPAELLQPTPRTLPARAPVDGLLLAAPIVLGDGPEAWVVCAAGRAGPMRSAALMSALEIAAAGLAGTFARRRLGAERDARLRAGLLAELRQVGDPLPAGLAERLLAVGWRTAGWHVGLELRAPRDAGDPAPAAALGLEELVASELGPSPLVAVAGGWAGWTTLAAEPGPEAYRRVVRAVGAIVRQAAPELVLCAGIGSPRAGLRGIGRTLEEAREAWQIAAAAGPGPRVEAIGEQDARRVLLHSVASPSLRPYAESLLAPLLAEPELLTTLERYLALECSTASTAAELGVHRNTVTHRVQRAQELLGVGLGSPDERLALRLACRQLRG